jgi:gliding motility-associated-like protein
MSKLYITLALLISLCLSFIAKADIDPINNSGTTVTAYTNGSPNDSIYIWCNEGLNTENGQLLATASSGNGPWEFNWYFHNSTTSSWDNLTVETGNESLLEDLPSGGYRVEIFDNNGDLVDCNIVWVWNLNTAVDADQSIAGCDATDLLGDVSATSNFTYYNPPPPEALIDANTEITICFDATHTFVSDLGFFLVGPASCGSPTIPLSPNPGSIGQGSVCNSGDNIVDLCFTNQGAGNLDVCTSTTPLTGTYSSYGLNPGTPIDWSPLIGCNAAEGGWSVQIYDCIGADVGALTGATISFSNLQSFCGSPTTITYDSGVISSAINDNSCDPASASIFEVPPSTEFSDPIVINATTEFEWTASQTVTIPNATADLNTSVTDIPPVFTTFYLNVNTSFNDVSCDYIDSVTFEYTCCNLVADAGADTSKCSEDIIGIGSNPEADVYYSWSPTDNLSDPNVSNPFVSITNNSGTSEFYTYVVTISDDLGCEDSDTIVIEVFPIPTVDLEATPSTGVVPITIDFSNPNFNPNYDYSWDFNNGNTSSENVPDLSELYENAGEYTIVLTAEENGCLNSTAVDIVLTYVYPDFSTPNVFTPNGDNVNDYFQLVDIVGRENIEEFNCSIINRWGNVMITFDDPEFQWNGTDKNGREVTEGTYFFKVDVTVLDGSTIQQHGFVQLVRDNQ